MDTEDKTIKLQRLKLKYSWLSTNYLIQIRLKA